MTTRKKEDLLFSLTKKDFILETFCTGGKGGQNQNKRKMGVRIRHPASGAVSEGREERSYEQNKNKAFRRLIEKPEFKKWHKIECSKAFGNYIDIEKIVEDWMESCNLKIEYYDEEEKKWKLVVDHYEEKEIEEDGR